ncbi:uncharacterized protein LOC128714874 [Anopheles marshallii]|uniref:uncharacterized protein LOC128714874 n=1 Tax=Anopheles marshallii TaxID=1521116 RepID=UPI00237B5093|nr:uncharacterized protein LOC128714874 [Anopheles marshallii]
MPFAIVEACEEDGSKELCVVPEGWILDTRHKETILLWPKCVGPKMYKLLNDSESVGNTTWLKIDCVVKKINIVKPYVAHELISKMKGESTATENSASSRCQLSKSPSPLGEDFTDSHVENYTSNIRNKKASPAPATTLTRREISTTSQTSEQTLLNFVQKLEAKLAGLEDFIRRLVDKLLRIETIAQVLLHRYGIKCVASTPMVTDVNFEQITNLESMEALNENLLNVGFQEQIYHWLASNITESQSENRMTEAMDLLFDKKFMTKCSWTGVGRGAEKIPMMRMVNITKLFRRIGTNNGVIVNQRMVMLFFMKKLRNAVRRSEMKHLRRSTTHHFKSNKVKNEN